MPGLKQTNNQKTPTKQKKAHLDVLTLFPNFVEQSRDHRLTYLTSFVTSYHVTCLLKSDWLKMAMFLK